ncbi:MAG TPA: ectonucleotide pyrophosphatase/phosphodiesterase [Pyrinomonadaceae bacterium]|nr:ectonucleotide pyrophosphatase/phosphodiesterase [Pyrinomonadaceae bacterium]
MNDTRYIRRGLSLILLTTALALGLAARASLRMRPASGPPAPVAKRAIIISLDGLDFRYLRQADSYGLKIPTLRRLMSEGVTAQVVGVYPSVTYPSHATIVTGVHPSRHAVYANEVFEPPDQEQTGAWYWYARDIRVDTLWQAAARRGLKTALISWPVGAGAGDYNFPEIFKIGGTREETSQVIKANARPVGLVEEVERHDPQLYRNLNKDEGDDMRTRFAEYLIAEKKPGLVLVHLFDLDHFEHDYGPFTQEALMMLEKLDGYVARILAAAERAGTLSETAVFVVSDHGFMPVSKRIHPGVVLARAGLLQVRAEKDARGTERAVVTNWRAAPYISGGSCAVILKDPKDRDAYDKALAAFKDFANKEGRGSLQILEAKELRGQKTNPNAAFFLEAADGYYFSPNYTGEAITAGKLKGQHGFLSSRYYTSFIASGVGIGRRGDLGTIRLIDEGPTIASTLGFKLSQAEGRALSLK